MSRFFAELKRRHMYRVAAAYAVVAWVLIQLIGNVSPMLRLPDWTGTLVLVLLAAGFPVALLFCWIQPIGQADSRGPAAATKLDWLLAAALIAVIGIFIYQQTEGAGTAREANSAGPGVGIAIAVLPFANLSGDASQEFFSDGMTEEINAALTKVPDLHVVARTSAFEFKGQNSNVRDVGQALGATHLIEGSVRKAGNRVRITVQLVRADNGLNLWSENYDRELTDIFAIQEDIAKAIARALRVPLGLARGDTLVRSRTTNEASYEDYLRARALVRSRGGGGGGPGRSIINLTRASTLLETVVAREPNFAPAWALLAYTYGLIPIFQPGFNSGIPDPVPIDANLPKAEAAANRAVGLDPKNPDGYFSLGFVRYTRGKYAEAADLFSQGMALDSSNPDGLHFYSGMLGDLGYLSQAVALRQRLQALEPFVPIYQSVTARVLLATGQTEAASQILGKEGSGITRASVAAAQSRFAQAADILSTAEGNLQPSREAATQLLRSAPKAAASPQSLPPLGYFEFVYAYVGAEERLLDFHEAMLRIGYYSGAVNLMLWGPSYASIRKTERFKAFVRNAGMVDFWRAKGFPDLCRPVDFENFVCD